MLLQGRVAVIYGGGGSIGGAVALAFAREGAIVHLGGRTQSTLDAVADRVRAVGGAAHTAVVDALDAAAVRAHADAVVAASGAIDVCLNVTSQQDVQGVPLVQMDVEDFLRPVDVTLRSTFLTATAAARHMIERKSGVILAFGGYGDPSREFHLGGLQSSFGAVESFRRNLAAELGPYGIRVVTLQTGGVAESLPTNFDGRADLVAALEAPTMLGRTATLPDVGNAAVFVASDWGRTLTATALNITCGATVD